MQSLLARAGKVDVRRDEEQNIKLSQIIKLLINAGYFRARIKGLSPFDKIIGGMTWCIEVCNFDVDVDLLFHDNLTIGQKIALTERIVNILPFMKCPHRIEPHQIQGLDSIHIFPVIQWLVKLATETRAEYQDDTRIIALDEFNRHYGLCYNKVHAEENKEVIRTIRDVKFRYGPKKRFKGDGVSAKQTNERILTTLLEYSEAPQVPELSLESDSDEEVDKELQARLSELMTLEDNPEALFTATLGDLSSIKSRKELSREGGTASIDTNIQALEQSFSMVTVELERKTEAMNRLIVDEENVREELNAKKESLLALKEETSELEAAVSNVDKDQFDQMFQLIKENEKMKEQSTTFKEECRREAEVLQLKIKELQLQLDEPEDAPANQSLVDLHALETKRLSKFRSEIGKKTREIESLKRVIDDVPGRAEIAQYQRRFMELYNLVRAEHHETLHFYNMYNTLADTRTYMEKELGLLNSIIDNMDQGLATSLSLEEYLQQLESIVDGIKTNKMKLEKRKTEAKIERSSLSAEFNRLQELQLLYSRLLHDFSLEISNNETLLDSLES